MFVPVRVSCVCVHVACGWPSPCVRRLRVVRSIWAWPYMQSYCTTFVVYDILYEHNRVAHILSSFPLTTVSVAWWWWRTYDHVPSYTLLFVYDMLVCENRPADIHTIVYTYVYTNVHNNYPHWERQLHIPKHTHTHTNTYTKKAWLFECFGGRELVPTQFKEWLALYCVFGLRYGARHKFRIWMYTYYVRSSCIYSVDCIDVTYSQYVVSNAVWCSVRSPAQQFCVDIIVLGKRTEARFVRANSG